MPIRRLRRIISGRLVRERVLAAVCVTAAVAVNAMFASTVRTPSFPFDEITYFQYARFLSGRGLDFPVAGAGYFPAWAMVLAPLWWLTSDPAVLYRTAIWMGVAIAVLTIWPLSRVVVRFGAGGPWSVTVAALVMCLPSRAVQSAYAMSEKMLVLCLVLASVAACRLAERMTWSRVCLFAAGIGLVVLCHARALVVLPAALVWLAFQVGRNRRLGAWALVLTTAAGAASWGFSIRLNDALLEGTFLQGGGLWKNLFSGPTVVVRILLGQLWYQLVSSCGLAVLGLVALVAATVRELRRKIGGVGPAAWILLVALAFLAISVLAWSSGDVVSQSGRGRFDFWVYGRYSDPAFALVVAVGLAYAVRTGLASGKRHHEDGADGLVHRRPWRRGLAARDPAAGPIRPGLATSANPASVPSSSSISRDGRIAMRRVSALGSAVRRHPVPVASGVTGTAILLATLLWVAPSANTWGVITPAHVAGILPWSGLLPFLQPTAPGWSSDKGWYRSWTWTLPTFTNGTRFWLIASLTAVVALVGVMLLRRRPAAVAALLAVVLCAGDVLSYPAVAAFQIKDGGEPEVVSLIERIESDEGSVRVVLDRSCVPRPGDSSWAQNEFTFWLQNGDFRYLDSYGELPSSGRGSELVISCAGFPERSGVAATRVGDVSSIGYELWVLPGALQRTLARRGLTVVGG